MLPKNVRSIVAEIFEEFQVNYQSGYYYEHQNQYRRNNNDVIDHFTKWCLSSKNRRAIQWSPENRKLMDELKLYLMNVYAD